MVPPEFESLTEEKKQELRKMFEKLVADGRNEEDAISELSKPCTQSVEIDLVDLMSAIDEAVAAGKTPLVVDNSEDDKVNTFFNYRSVVMMDAKKMSLDASLRKIPVEEIMEGARKQLVAALKMGSYLVICMTVAVADFATKFNDECAFPDRTDGKEFFPKLVFEKGGKGLLDDKHLEALFRQEDKADMPGNLAMCRDPEMFKVVITTKFAPEDFEEYLFSNEWGLPKPISQYRFIIVKPT